MGKRALILRTLAAPLALLALAGCSVARRPARLSTSLGVRSRLHSHFRSPGNLLRHRRDSRVPRTHADATPTAGDETSYSLFGLSKATYPPGWEKPEGRVEYRDSLVDRFLIGIFMDKMASATGVKRGDSTYEDFIKLCFESIRQKNASEQVQQSLDVLQTFLPPNGDVAFKKMFPKGKGSYEINAEITKVGFAWMVGPMTVETTTENDEGIPMASTVKIHKCRWLQESACTGMCCNMCKVPTQKFFTETFGLPLTIRPNFEDKSCEFCFGLTPPPIKEDPTYLQPCHVRCPTAKLSDDEVLPCHKLMRPE